MPTPSSQQTSRMLRVLPFVLVLLAMVFSSTSLDPNDTWWHIRLGQYYLDHGDIPDTDVFSHTAAGQTLYTHEWLSQVILYVVYSGLGFAGIRLLNTLLAALTMFLLWRFYRKATDRTLPILFGIVMIFPDFLGRMNTRPDIFTLPLFVACIHFLMHRDRSRLPSFRIILSVAIIASLWSNLHSMALLGLMFLMAYAGGEFVVLSLRRWMTVPEWETITKRGFMGDVILVVVYALAVLVTPNFHDIYVYAWEGRQFLPGPLGIMEWLSPFQFLGSILHSFLMQDFPWINVSLGWQFLFITVPLAYCFAVPFLAMRRQLPTLPEILLVLLALYQAATVVRFRWLFFIPLFWVVRAIGNATRSTVAEGEGRRVPGAVLVLHPLMLLIIASGIFMMFSRGITFTQAIDKKSYPIGIANFLDDLDAKGNLFNSYNWGGYFIFRLWPDYRVFIDGRTGLYALSSRNLMLDHVAIENQETGYDKLLESYDVDILVSMGKIYFPGPEYKEESDNNREMRRSQLAGQRSKRAPPMERPPPDRTAEDWVPMLVNREGSVYLKGDRKATLKKLAEFYGSRGIPFEPTKGPDVAAVIRAHPALAVRYRILSDDLVRGAIESVEEPDTDKSIETKVALAKAFVDLELFRDGIAILEDVLESDRYNADALSLAALTHHLLGENDAAYAYLERSVAVGGNTTARVLIQHCSFHQAPQSISQRRLPPLEELVVSWKALYP